MRSTQWRRFGIDFVTATTTARTPPRHALSAAARSCSGPGWLLPAVLRGDGADAANDRDSEPSRQRIQSRPAQTARSSWSVTTTPIPGSRSTSTTSAGCPSTRPPRRRRRSCNPKGRYPLRRIPLRRPTRRDPTQPRAARLWRTLPSRDLRVAAGASGPFGGPPCGGAGVGRVSICAAQASAGARSRIRSAPRSPAARARGRPTRLGHRLAAGHDPEGARRAPARVAVGRRRPHTQAGCAPHATPPSGPSADARGAPPPPPRAQLRGRGQGAVARPSRLPPRRSLAARRLSRRRSRARPPAPAPGRDG